MITTFQCSWIITFNIVRMAALPKETYRLIPNHIKYPMTFCTQIEEKTFKLYGSTKYQEYPNLS
jgi:hypothetical protein